MHFILYHMKSSQFTEHNIHFRLLDIYEMFVNAHISFNYRVALLKL